MKSTKFSVESILGELKTAIVAQAIDLDLARRGIGGGSIGERTKPLAWLEHLPADERVPFSNWLWAVAKPSEEDAERDTVISARSGYCLRVIADALNDEAEAAA